MMSTDEKSERAGQERKGESWNERNFSQSANSILRQFSRLSQGADLIQLLESFDKIHPEYGGSTLQSGKNKSSESGPVKELIDFLYQLQKELKLTKLTSAEWAEEVLSIFLVPDEPSLTHIAAFRH